MCQSISAFIRTVALMALPCAALLSGCSATKGLFSSGSTDIQEIISENNGVQATKEKRIFGFLTPYRIDVQQGNFVSSEMVAQLKEKMKSPEGITSEQVRFVMGAPLVDDMFHKNRWDYPFRIKKSNGEIITSHVSVFFKDNKLVNVEGGELPTEKEYLSLIAGRTPPPAQPESPKTDSTKK